MRESKELHEKVAASIGQKHANDSREVRARLADFAKRGTDTPESLTTYEIRQIAFALALYMSLDD